MPAAKDATQKKPKVDQLMSMLECELGKIPPKVLLPSVIRSGGPPGSGALLMGRPGLTAKLLGRRLDFVG